LNCTTRNELAYFQSVINKKVVSTCVFLSWLTRPLASSSECSFAYFHGLFRLCFTKYCVTCHQIVSAFWERISFENEKIKTITYLYIVTLSGTATVMKDWNNVMIG